MQNIGKHHEFQKDPMLKKIVLLVVSFFSIATEIRMISQEDLKKHEKLFYNDNESNKQLREDIEYQLKIKEENAEVWHAQSLFFGALYLPNNCPLINHVNTSYTKHYFVEKATSFKLSQIKNSEIEKVNINDKLEKEKKEKIEKVKELFQNRTLNLQEKLRKNQLKTKMIKNEKLSSFLD